MTNQSKAAGTPMGRPKFGSGYEPTEPFALRRVRINQGGYDDGGTYWGTGQPLYWYCSYAVVQEDHGKCEYCEQGVRYALNGECRWSKDGNHVFPKQTAEVEVSDYIRADDREHAKAIVRAKYPTARFRR